MRKKIVAAMLAGMLVLTPMTRVSAEPIVDSTTQSQYDEKQAKYNELLEKVQALDTEISDLIVKINDNNTQIDNINSEIENVNKEIEQTKLDIQDQEEVLGQRLREIYKSGGQASYISILFSAESFSDLISKIDNAKTLISLDKKVVNELTESKDKLDKKVGSLQDKAKEVEALNAEVKEQKEEADSKKADQEVVLAQAKEEKEAFEKDNIVPMEQSAVEPWIAQATNSNNTIDQIKMAISRLDDYKKQLQSQVVINSVNDAISKGNSIVSEKNKKQQAETNRGNIGVTVSGSASNLINYASKFLGVPYVWGGTSPSGFDCSGFTQYVFKNAAGISIGRSTYDQINAGREVSYNELQPGDLVFPHSGHVGIYIGNGQMIHAPQTGDVVKISSVYKFWRARRVLN